MKKKLKSELNAICREILEADKIEEIPGIYEKAQVLYEKLAVLKFIDEKLKDIQIDVTKNIIADKFEKMANAVLSENKSVPESNPHAEDIITPGIDTIKDMVSEMPSSAEVEQVFREFVAKPETVKNDMEEVTPNGHTEVKVKSLNDTLVGKEINVGLNDRHGFVKHLFNNSSEDFNRVISQLNTIDSEERSIAFIEEMVKPDYGNWEGKEEYEKRFMNLIARRFS